MKRFLKISLILILLLLVSNVIFSIPYGTNTTVSFADTPIPFTAKPMTLRGCLIVPAEELFDAMGTDYSFDETNKEITAYQNGVRLIISLNSNRMSANGKAIFMAAAPKKINGVIYVDVKKVVSALGMSVVSEKGTFRIVPPTPTGVFSVEQNGDQQLFTNHYDGFCLSLPADFTVDMSMPMVLSRFSSEQFTLEVYREENRDLDITQAYLSYTNRAVTESTDLTVTTDQSMQIGDKTYQVLS